MHLTIPRNRLLPILTPLHTLSTRASTIPILQSLLLEASANACRITATDLDITASRELPAHVDTEGTVALPAAPLRAIVGELPDADIQIAVDATHRATISCRQSTITLQGLPKDDFPSIREPHGNGITLNRSIFLDLIRHTLFAASADSTRLILNGMLLHADSNGMQMVATDGRRLAIAQATTGAADAMPLDAIIPRKAGTIILKLWPEESETITLEIDSGHLLLHSDGTLLAARLFDGQYPNYQSLIPANPTRQATINRDALLTALRRTSTILDEPTHCVTFTFTPGTLTLRTTNLDLGEAQEPLEAVYPHDEFAIGLNARYLLDFLSTLDNEQITIQLEDATNPALFSTTEEERYRYVIAPMRLN